MNSVYEPNKVLIERIDKELPIPFKNYPNDCCFDLLSAEDVVIYPNQPLPTLISTGIKVLVPKGYELQIRGRSGIAKNHNVTIGQGIGTLDHGYTGIIYVMLVNHGQDPFNIKKGDRIAQAVVKQVPEFVFVEVDKLPETDRGERGFGSSGV